MCLEHREPPLQLGRDGGPVSCCPGPVLTGPVLTGPVLTGPALTGPALTGPAMTSPVLTGPVLADPAGVSTVRQAPGQPGKLVRCGDRGRVGQLEIGRAHV